MFETMVTEPVPARVYELFRVVNSHRSINRSELERLLLPDGLYTKTKPVYFAPTLKAAEEIGIIKLVDNNVLPLVNSKELRSLDDLRVLANIALNSYKNGQFYRTTNSVLNMNDEALKYSQITDLGKKIESLISIKITDTQIRGWRFWAEFLGFGNMQGMTFLPNAYLFLKSIIPSCGFEKGQIIQIDEFMNKINVYGSILNEGNQNQYLNLAFSNGLRQLHENNELRLIHRNDKDVNQQLYPSQVFFNETVTEVEFRGLIS